MNCVVLYNTFHATDGFNFLCYIYQFHENTCLLDDFDSACDSFYCAYLINNKVIKYISEDEELVVLGVTEEELIAIKLLAKPDKEDYLHYIDRVAVNPLARRVKMADLTHNMDLSRLLQITKRDKERREKYQKAYNLLNDIENEVIEER